MKNDDDSNELGDVNLLAFDGQNFWLAAGYVMTIRIAWVGKSVARPHGYRYTLSLMAPNAAGKPTTRILGADNAHAVAGAKRHHAHDHWHAAKMGPAGTMPIGVFDGVAIGVSDLFEHISVFYEAAKHLLKESGLDLPPDSPHKK